MKDDFQRIQCWIMQAKLSLSGVIDVELDGALHLSGDSQNAFLQEDEKYYRTI